MKEKLYGIDLEGEITPLMVRDAISQCFFEAHCEDTGFNQEDKEGKERNQLYCQQIVKKSFEDSDGDFENPTKKDIENSLNNLKEFSKKFRDQSIIKKHFEELKTLTDKLD